MSGTFKYVVAGILILVLLLALRSCKGPIERWREDREERIEERRESWREWWRERRDNRKADRWTQ